MRQLLGGYSTRTAEPFGKKKGELFGKGRVPDEETMSSKPQNDRLINLRVVLDRAGQVLMIRRVKKEKGSDGSVLEWAFPGGVQRNTETRSECVTREVRAETGYEIIPVKEISERTHPQFRVFIVYHRCTLASLDPASTPQQPHEVAEVKWIQPADLEKLVTTDFDPAVRKELGL